MLGSTTANSSPPSRASVSCSRRTLGRRLARKAQQLVAELVAQRVVDALEIVQVQAQHGGGAAVAGRVQRLQHLFAEQPPVGHAGQRVVVGHVAHLRMGGVLVGDVIGDQQHIARARIAVVEHQRLGTQRARAQRGGQLLFLFAHGAVRAQRIIAEPLEEGAGLFRQAFLHGPAAHVGAVDAEHGLHLAVGQHDPARHRVHHQHAGRDLRNHRVQEARQRAQLGVVALGHFLGAQQLLFLHAALGLVARDLGVAEQFAAVAVDRVDHHAGPEQGAVAHAPALGGELAPVAGPRQSGLRQARGPVFRGIEAGEILADDLVGRIALVRSAPAFQLATVPSGDSI